MKSKMLVLFNLHFVSIKCQFVLVILSHKVPEKNIANFWCFHHKYEKDRSYFSLKIWTHNRMRKKNSFIVKINTYIFRLIFFYHFALYHFSFKHFFRLFYWLNRNKLLCTIFPPNKSLWFQMQELANYALAVAAIRWFLKWKYQLANYHQWHKKGTN